jgi:hypothetical protein
MAGNKYLSNSAGALQEVTANQTSAGATDAGKIVALTATGVLDTSVMPTGIGAETASVVASEALAAGALVNIYNNAGTPNVRNANATTSGKEAHGFVLAAFASAATATVYLAGINNQVTGLTAGNLFLGTTAGAATATAPSASGNVVQRIGVATSATAIAFNPETPIVLA